MLESIVIGFLATAFIGAGTSGTFGPHQEPAAQETVAVLGADGNVLYYNYK